MVAHRSGPRTEDEPSEIARLERTRLGAWPQNAGARLPNPVGRQGRSAATSQASRHQPARRECLYQRPENAEEKAGSEMIQNRDYVKIARKTRIEPCHDWRQHVCYFQWKQLSERFLQF